MNRKNYILQYAKKSSLGLEIAPYHNPIAPKKDGWNCLSLDIVNYEKLISFAEKDPDPFVRENIKNIEKVDIVSSAIDIKEAIENLGMLGCFDYICSSHNFEHLPNPLRFLRSAGDVLKIGGHLSMAIPNKRLTFDYARPLTGTKDILRMYLDNYTQPDPFTIFESQSSHVNYGKNLSYNNNIKDCFNRMLENLNKKNPYTDIHMTVFTPESFIHITNDLMMLNLIPFEIIDYKISGIEFIVHFVNRGYGISEDLNKNYEERRHSLIDICFKN